MSLCWKRDNTLMFVKHDLPFSTITQHDFQTITNILRFERNQAFIYPNQLLSWLVVDISRRLDLEELVRKCSVPAKVPETVDLLCPRPLENEFSFFQPDPKAAQFQDFQIWRRTHTLKSRYGPFPNTWGCFCQGRPCCWHTSMQQHCSSRIGARTQAGDVYGSISLMIGNLPDEKPSLLICHSLVIHIGQASVRNITVLC